MEVVSYTKAKQNFNAVMEMVCDNHEPCIIAEQNKKPVVMLSLDDFNAMERILKR